jgi:hypothetical protein
MSESETETTFRFDHEERVLWACTTDAATARRWQKHGLPVAVKGTVNGEPNSWAFRLQATESLWRQKWRQVFVWAIPPGWASHFSYGGSAPSSTTGGGENEDPAEEDPTDVLSDPLSMFVHPSLR